MSQGTPPTKTFWEYTGFLWVRGGSCPLHVQVASLTAEKSKILFRFSDELLFTAFDVPQEIPFKTWQWPEYWLN